MLPPCPYLIPHAATHTKATKPKTARLSSCLMTKDYSYWSTAERQTLPSSKAIAGMHKVAAKVNQELVAHWAGGVPIKEEELPELAAMNELYCHALVGGKNVIVGQRFCQVQGNVLTFESPAEFKKKFLHIKKINSINRGQAFLEWPGKNFKLGGTGFFPDPKKCPEDALNFYRGLQVKPMAGDVSTYLDHLK